MAEKICFQLSARRMRKQMQPLQQMLEWLEEVVEQLQEVETTWEDLMLEAVVEAAIVEWPRWAQC